jgi:hypothetical protein
MTTLATRLGPNGRAARPSLGDQLDRLDGILNGLADALNQSVTAAVTAAVGNAVRAAVDSATREMAARPARQGAMISDSEATVVRRPRRPLWALVRAVVRRSFASARGAAGRLSRRLGAPLVTLTRRTLRAPGRFAAVALAGVVAGAASGLCGPVIGAALGSLSGFGGPKRYSQLHCGQRRTLVLVARTERLALPDDQIQGWFDGLPPQRPFQDARSAVWFENGRIVTGDDDRRRRGFDETDIADPVLRVQGLLKERIGPHAAGTAAVSFARLGQRGMP